MTIYSPLTSAVEFLRQSFQRRVGDGTIAHLGNADGRIPAIGKPGYVYIRYPGVPDNNGNTTFSAPAIARSIGVSYPRYPNAQVYVGIGYSGELEILSAHSAGLSQAGINTAASNDPQDRWVYLWQLTIGLCSAVATTVSGSMLVTVKKFRHYSGNRFQTFETGAQADKIDLTSYLPAVDNHRFAAVWTDTYGNVAAVTTSTTQSMTTPLDSTDIDELVTSRPPDAIPHKAFYLANNQGTITQQAAKEVDLRQFLNMPQLHGFTSPVSYRERIQPDRQVLFAGSLSVTSELIVLGELVGIPQPSQGGSGGSGITELTGDVTAGPGSGSQAATLATVNSSPGTTRNSRITTNGKGLVTANTDGPNIKPAVRLATAAALDACTYSNGSSGVGATLTADANGALSVDGVAVAANDRVLIKNQASALQNGIYTVTQTGSAGAPFILTRDTDSDASDEILKTVVFVQEGTVNTINWYACTDTSAITVGTTDINFAPSRSLIPIPRMSVANRNALSSPVNGSLVFTTDQLDVSLFQGAWLNLVKPFRSFLLHPFSEHTIVSGTALVWQTNTSDNDGGYYFQSSGAINNEVSYEVALPVGTYHIEYMVVKGSNFGIMSLIFDGNTISTHDLYAAATTYNVRGSSSDFNVNIAGVYTFSHKAASKNASSSNYVIAVSWFQFIRTANYP